MNRQTLHLLSQLVKRDLQSRYQGSLLGGVWLVIQPLLLLAIYSLVFGIVFKARGIPSDQQAIPFPLFFFAGLIVHQALADTLLRSATLIRSHANYVKKVVFPLWLLPVMVVISALVMFLIQFALLVAAMLIMRVPVALEVIYVLPAIFFAYFLFLLALSWLTAALGLFLPDLSQVMGLAVTALLFLSPVFYSLQRLPEIVQDYQWINPLIWVIEQFRATVFDGVGPDIFPFSAYNLGALILAFMALKLFRRIRPAFNDVL